MIGSRLASPSSVQGKKIWKRQLGGLERKRSLRHTWGCDSTASSLLTAAASGWGGLNVHGNIHAMLLNNVDLSGEINSLRRLCWREF